MSCASAAGAGQAVASTAQCPILSRFRHRHPLCSALPPSAASVSPNPHLPTAGLSCRGRRLSLSKRSPFSAEVAAANAATNEPDVPLEVVEFLKEGSKAAAGVPDVPLEVVGLPKEKVQVPVKGGDEVKPKLVLKFIWMDKNIGLALDQMVPGHGTVPLSPYYFWPRKDAWEELKALLESKPWISQKRMIILLNQATDIINLWQQSGAGSLQQ